MPLWIVIGVAAAVFVLVIVVAATFNVFSADAADETEADWDELGADFTADDLDRLSFRPALRGYRMEDVDRALALMTARIRSLEGRAGASAGTAIPQQSSPAEQASPAAAQDPETPGEDRSDLSQQVHGQR